MLSRVNVAKNIKSLFIEEEIIKFVCVKSIICLKTPIIFYLLFYLQQNYLAK